MMHRILAGLLCTALTAVLATADDKSSPPPKDKGGNTAEPRKVSDTGKTPADKGNDLDKGGVKVGVKGGGKSGDKGGG